jgi:hypothetical protein
MADINQLLKDGIAAAREGDKARAKELFEQVTSLDENNAKAWLWLGSLMDTDEERRICYSNVLQIEPQNERALAAMAKLDARKKQTKDDEEVAPGITRRQLMMYGGGAVAIIVVLVVVVSVIIGANNARISQDATAQAELIALRATTEMQQTNTVGTSTAAALALITPSAVPTLTRAVELPPTWTPTGEAAVDTGPVALPALTGVSGTLVGWRGFDQLGTGFMGLARYDLTRPNEPQVIDDLVLLRDLRVFPGGNRLIYTRYYSTQQDTGVEENILNGTSPQPIGQRFPGQLVVSVEQPSLRADGLFAVFVADQTLNDPAGGVLGIVRRQLITIDLSEPVSDPNLPTNAPEASSGSAGGFASVLTPPLRRISQTTSDYSYPAYSPDGQFVAAVTNNRDGFTPGTDIVIVDVASGIEQPVTDNQDQYIERDLVWSPDGASIAYATTSPDDPDNHDILIVQPNGQGTLALVRSPGVDDVRPVFSPDGRYLAYSSNRSGNYDIYILDRQTNETYQLTNDAPEDYVGGWIP